MINGLTRILFFYILFTTNLISGCSVPSNVNKLRASGKFHYTFYYEGKLEDIYNNALKKFNECGLAISNNFIDANTGEAGISYTGAGAGAGMGWFSHMDLKKETSDKTRMDAYSIIDWGVPGNFLKITRWAAETKPGCPPDLF